jgi:hypothetical protein
MHAAIRPVAQMLASSLLVSAMLAFAPQASNPGSPLMRSSPKIEEVQLEVQLFSQAPLDINDGIQTTSPGGRVVSVSTRPAYRAQAVSLGIPVLLRTSWCDTDFSKGTANIWVDGIETKPDMASVLARGTGQTEASLRFEARLQRGACDSLTVRGTYQVQMWELAIDEQAAAKATWPREWPDSMARFLKQEEGINPTNPAVKSLAEGATKGGFRSVTPFVAARNAVVAVTRKWSFNNSSTSIYGQRGALRGIRFSDGPWGLDAGGGTPVELAATCVAAVRSIGIPARIVYCLEESGRQRRDSKGNIELEFRFICEFFLPGIGWIPFDPMTVKQQSGGNQGGSIRGFANIPDLQQCLPLSYQLVLDGYARADRFALWGWKPGVDVDSNRAVSRIGAERSGRGNGPVPRMAAPATDDVK